MRYKLEAGIAEAKRRTSTRDYCIEDELLVEAGERIDALQAENAELRQKLEGTELSHDIGDEIMDDYEAQIEKLQAELSTLRESMRWIPVSDKAIIAEQAERIATLETACKSLAELAHQSHAYCEDSWYSCPMAEDGCANDRRGPQCDCGAEEQNTKVNSIMLSAGVG